MVTIGYVIYALSWSFTSVVVGFIILGFFDAFLNAGVMTFYQNNVSIDVMGRVTSIFQMIQSMGQIVFILLIGIIGDLVSLRLTIVTMALFMFALAIVFSFFVFKKDKKSLYKEDINLTSNLS